MMDPTRILTFGDDTDDVVLRSVSIPTLVAFGTGDERVEDRVVIRSVTPPRRRTLLTHWTEETEGELRVARRRHGTAVLDIPFWVAESLDIQLYSSYVYTHVLLFQTDPRDAPPDSTLLCWSAGHALGHGLGGARSCLGHADHVVMADVSFWNTSFNRAQVRRAEELSASFRARPGVALIRPAEWKGESS